MKNIKEKINIWDVLTAISYLLIVVAFVVNYYARTRMGMQRDLAVRNKILNEGIFSESMRSVLVTIGVIIVVGIVILWIINRTRKIELKYFDVLFAVGLLLFLLLRYDSVPSLGYPWIVLSIFILAVVEILHFISDTYYKLK